MRRLELVAMHSHPLINYVDRMRTEVGERVALRSVVLCLRAWWGNMLFPSSGLDSYGSGVGLRAAMELYIIEGQ